MSLVVAGLSTRRRRLEHPPSLHLPSPLAAPDVAGRHQSQNPPLMVAAPNVAGAAIATAGGSEQLL
jgi:hypothetical protein